MPITIIAGQPGTTWTNDTAKTLWQFTCSFQNSCGRCIQFAGQIGPWWPLPIHRSCHCRNTPVLPGSTSTPFIDFRKEVEALPPHQQARVMGASNWKLVSNGIVDWKDVVHDQRILSFREVVATRDLSVKQLVKAGVSKYQAARAYDVTHSAAITTADRTRVALVELLEARGVPLEEIRKRVGEGLMKRIGIAGGPPGAAPGRIILPPPLAPLLLPAALARPLPDRAEEDDPEEEQK